ncbi:hypothetical protein U1Q18_007246 [Sarracenia purpurea var. burkii]
MLRHALPACVVDDPGQTRQRGDPKGSGSQEPGDGQPNGERRGEDDGTEDDEERGGDGEAEEAEEAAHGKRVTTARTWDLGGRGGIFQGGGPW